MDASTSSTIEPESMYNYMNGLLMNPTVFIILVVVVIAYIIVFVSLGDSSTTNSYTTGTIGTTGMEGTSNVIIMIIVGVLIVLVLFNALQYFFSIDIMASIQNLFTPQKQMNIVVNQNNGQLDVSYNDGILSELTDDIISQRQQVFNVPGNYYGYEDAKTLCKAYNARLATYGEVEQAYNKGGEWCNYGWSEGQMALFPTQKTTFDNLQKISGHEHDCGRPGVNGGYIANPHVQFGVNCYGYKPKITTEEEEMMQNASPYPKTEKDIAMEKRVDYWKTKIDEILLSPFNYSTWSKV
jgi:hypothetical protein